VEKILLVSLPAIVYISLHDFHIQESMLDDHKLNSFVLLDMKDVPLNRTIDFFTFIIIIIIRARRLFRECIFSIRPPYIYQTSNKNYLSTTPPPLILLPPILLLPIQQPPLSILGQIEKKPFGHKKNKYLIDTSPSLSSASNYSPAILFYFFVT
jgi:hypothetical protein